MAFKSYNKLVFILPAVTESFITYGHVGVLVGTGFNHYTIPCCFQAVNAAQHETSLHAPCIYNPQSAVEMSLTLRCFVRNNNGGFYEIIFDWLFKFISLYSRPNQTFIPINVRTFPYDDDHHHGDVDVHDDIHIYTGTSGLTVSSST